MLENLENAKTTAAADFAAIRNQVKTLASRLEVLEEVQGQVLATSITSTPASIQEFSIQQMVDFEDKIKELEKKTKAQVEIVPQIVARLKMTEEMMRELKKPPTVTDVAEKVTKLAMVCQGLNQRISKLTGENLH